MYINYVLIKYISKVHNFIIEHKIAYKLNR